MHGLLERERRVTQVDQADTGATKLEKLITRTKEIIEKDGFQ